jgi:hypothetical protein
MQSLRLFGYDIAFDRAHWTATRVAARLGIVAATLSGIALAMHAGGQDGYAVPLSALLGAPTNGLLWPLVGRLLHIRLEITSAGAHSAWDGAHLLFCGMIALNWTAIGVAMDLARWQRSLPPTPPVLGSSRSNELQLQEPSTDTLLTAFEELEREVRERRGLDRQPSARRAA